MYRVHAYPPSANRKPCIPKTKHFVSLFITIKFIYGGIHGKQFVNHIVLTITFIKSSLEGTLSPYPGVVGPARPPHHSRPKLISVVGYCLFEKKVNDLLFVMFDYSSIIRRRTVFFFINFIVQYSVQKTHLHVDGGVALSTYVILRIQ